MTDLYEHISGDDIFSEILMLRNVSSQVFLVLEGSSDCSTLDNHIDSAECETIPAHSKPAVVRAIELADLNNIPKVLGMVDRDWIGFGEEITESENLVTTDYYDLEATILFSGDLIERFFGAQTDRHARVEFLAQFPPENLTQNLANLTLPVGLLRYISFKNHLALSMRHYPAHMALDQNLTSINLEVLVETALGRSKQSTTADQQDLLQTLSETISQTTDAKDYCSGRDIACCLMFILARRFHRSMSIDVLLGSLRAMFGLKELQRTSFYAKINDWGKRQNILIWQTA